MGEQRRFVVLGPVGVVVDGQHLQPTASRTRTLLAALLLNFPRPLGHEVMVELVWGGPASRNSVYVALTRLRRWLAERVGVAIDYGAGGYRLRTSSEAIDAHLFLRLVSTADQTDGVLRLNLLLQAIELWQGEVAEQTTEAVAGHRLVAELNQARVQAVLTLAEQAVALGTGQQALRHVEVVAGSEPLDEPLQAALALLLASVGRQADALAVIERTRRSLAEELGVDPGLALQKTQMKILQHKVPVRHAGTTGLPSSASRSSRPAWVGVQPVITEIVGRDFDIKQLGELLSSRRLVTVLGPGGVGKTTVALRVAESIKNGFSGGVLALSVLRATNVEELLSAMAELLEVDATTHDAIRSGVEAALSDVPTLLLLDNCEHLTAECAQMARHLLGTAKQLVVLATSRELLGLPEETCWRLAPLRIDAADIASDEVPPAVALFQLRASQADLSYHADPTDFAHVERICRRLDGLPLAIEIAAARIATVRPAEMADLLERDLGLLDAPRVGVAARHRTLQATVDWSWRLLEPACQRLLARLSTFPAGVTMDAAVQVCGTAPLGSRSVPALLAQMVDRSLVQPRQSSAGRRFRLLEAVREFAAERLEDWHETTTCADAHLEYWLTRVRELDAIAHYDRRLRVLAGWTEDADNLYAALDHAANTSRADDVAELLARGFEFWLTGPGRLVDGLARLEWVLSSDAGTEEVRCLAQFWAGLTAAMRLDYHAARQKIAALLDRMHALRPREYGHALACLTTSATGVLDPAALRYADTMLAAVGDDDSIDAPGTALSSACYAAVTWGRLDDAAELFARYDRWRERVGRPISTVQLALRAEQCVGRGDLRSARAGAAQLLRRLFEAGDPAESEPPRRAVTAVYLACDQPEQASRFAGRGLRQLEARWPGGMSRTLPVRVLYAEALRRRGHLDDAAVALDGVLSEALRRRSHRVGLTAVLVCALLAADRHDRAAAADLAARWDELRTLLGLPVPVGLAGAAQATFGVDTVATHTDWAASQEAALQALVERALTYLRGHGRFKIVMRV